MGEMKRVINEINGMDKLDYDNHHPEREEEKLAEPEEVFLIDTICFVWQLSLSIFSR